MNIAFVINQLIVGGAEQYVIIKSEWFIKRGHNVIVISEGGIWENKLPDGVKHFKLKGLMSSPYAMKKNDYCNLKNNLADILIDNNINIVEGQNTWPIVHVINSYWIHKKPFYMNILSELSYNKNFILQYATILLNKEHLYYTLTPKMNSYIEDKCHIQLNPSVINIPIKVETNIITKDSNYILSVCRMSPEKMYVKSLIREFTSLVVNEKSIKHKLIVVGNGDLFNEVSELVRQCNNIIGKEWILMKGTVVGDDLTQLFSSCTIYVGMGTTLLTAASMAKPCIRCGFETSTMDKAWGFWGDNPETDKDEIVFASTSNHSNEESFRSILRRTLSDNILRNNMGKKAQNLFIENYSLNRVMNKWELEYKNIISSYDSKRLSSICRKIQRFSSIFYNLYRLYSLRFLFKI